jgi:hypothetical protein
MNLNTNKLHQSLPFKEFIVIILVAVNFFRKRPYGVVVSTSGFDSDNPGSNPGMASFFAAFVDDHFFQFKLNGI